MKNEDILRKAAQNFIWDKPYKKISRASKVGPRKWFMAGKLNYTKTIFERNFALGNASKEAVVFYKSPLRKESYTYASLLDEVNVLASYLEQKGISKKSRVLILTDSKKEQVFLILSLLRLGVQFGVLYSKFPPSVVDDLINDSGATHIISNKKLAKLIAADRPVLIKLNNTPKKKGGRALPPRPRSVSSNFSCFLSFSSGTTGKKPKIFLEGVAGFFIGGDHILQSDFFYDLKKYFILNTLDFAFGNYPLMAGLVTPLNRGGKAVLFDFEYRLNDKSIIKILEKEGVEAIISSPPFFEISRKKYRTGKIKKMILGGQKISRSVFDLIIKTFPGTHLINAVGSQETFAYLTSFSQKNSELINILRPLPELEYKIINKEFFIKDTWPCLVLPLNNKSAYRKRWRGRFFKTGDMVKKTKLGLEIIGRTDKAIKHRGRQINLEYLENILESQPSIQKARCLIVPKKPKPEIAVFLRVKRDGIDRLHHQLEKIIKKIIEDKFGSYIKPGKIIFIREFPTSASGKIMEKLLLKKYVR